VSKGIPSTRGKKKIVHAFEREERKDSGNGRGAFVAGKKKQAFEGNFVRDGGEGRNGFADLITATGSHRDRGGKDQNGICKEETHRFSGWKFESRKGEFSAKKKQS